MYDELAPMNVAQMMDRAIEAYKRSFWKQFAYAAVVGLALSVIVSIVGSVLFIFFVAGALGGYSVTGMLVFLFAVLLPIFLLWLGVSSAGHILFARQALIGHLVRLPRLKLHLLCFRALSAVAAITIVFVPVAVPLFYLYWAAVRLIAAVFFDAPLDYGAAAYADIYTTIGNVLLGVFLVLLATALVSLAFLLVENLFALAACAAMFEGRLFFSSLFRSWELLRGDFFRIFAARMLWYLVALGFAVAAIGILTGLVSLVSVLGGTVHPLFSILAIPLLFLSMVFPNLVFFAMLPMDGIMRAVVYFNQRIKKEGMDIELKLHMLMQRKAA